MLFAVAVVGTVHLEQIFLVACQVKTGSSSFSVDGQGVNAAKLSDEPMGAVFIVIEVNEVGNADHILGAERIGIAVPCGFENVHRFLVAFLTDSLIGIQSGLDATDTVTPTLLVVVELDADFLVGFHKGKCGGVAAEDESTKSCTGCQRSRHAELLCKEHGFILLGHTKVHLALDRQVISSVEVLSGSYGMLTVEHEVATVTAAHLGFVCDTLIELVGDLLSTLGIEAMLAILSVH